MKFKSEDIFTQFNLLFNNFDGYNYDLKKKLNKLKYNAYLKKKQFWDKLGSKIKGKIIAIGSTNVYNFTCKGFGPSYNYNKILSRNNLVTILFFIKKINFNRLYL